MKVLIVKMSSLGDVIHALPALVDAKRENPDIEFDWVVEEAFSDIPQSHPLVNKVIPIAIRRWRNHWLQSLMAGEIKSFLGVLRKTNYDLVIDAQGLIKSGVVAKIARGPVGGFDRGSARESLACLVYARSVSVDLEIHAVERQRNLFAGLLGYEVQGQIDYGLSSVSDATRPSNSVMLLHGTTWSSKLWPQIYWQGLCRILLSAGYEVLIPSSNEEEKERAKLIADDSKAVLMPSMGLKEIMEIIATCRGVVSVDTGLGHLACALNIPLVALYGSTDPTLTGIVGPRQSVIVSDHLECIPCKKRNCRYGLGDNSVKIYPPCFEQMTPESVWQVLRRQISEANQPSG